MLLNKGTLLLTIIVNIFNLSDKERENALNEVRILASCQNKNVISYKEAFIENESNSL